MVAPFGELAGQEPPAGATPARPLAAYAGTFRNDYYGPIEVAEEAGGLESGE